MKIKTFFIGLLLILFFGLIFNFPSGSLYLFIPSLLFTGIIGGVYVGIIRKRPMINCFYDGFFVGLPGGVLLSVILSPLLWFYHDFRNSSPDTTFPVFYLLVLAGTFFLTGFGGPFGGLLVGLYYRYGKKDRGEMELYESYLQKKIDDKAQNSKTDEADS